MDALLARQRLRLRVTLDTLAAGEAPPAADAPPPFPKFAIEAAWVYRKQASNTHKDKGCRVLTSLP